MGSIKIKDIKKSEVIESHNRVSKFLENCRTLTRVNKIENLKTLKLINEKTLRKIGRSFAADILLFESNELIDVVGGKEAPLFAPKNSKQNPWVLYVVSPEVEDLMEVFHKKALQFMHSKHNDNRSFCIITNLKEIMVCDLNHYISQYSVDFENYLNKKSESINSLVLFVKDFQNPIKNEQNFIIPLQVKQFREQFKGDRYNTIIKKNTNKKSEENIKVHIVDKILTQHLTTPYSQEDIDFEHDSRGKRIDIALLQGKRVRVVIEVKDTSNLSAHVDQALNYAIEKGSEWFILTNGIEWQFYATHIAGIKLASDRLIFKFNIFDEDNQWGEFNRLISRNEVFNLFEKNLKDLRARRRPAITADILHSELQYAKDILYNDLVAEFISKYKTNTLFKDEINDWALKTKLNINDKQLIEKLCMEGAYSLINRLLLYKVSEAQGLVPEKLTEDCISKWKHAVAEPQKELLKAFSEANNFYADFFNYPLFNCIRFEHITWNENHIRDILGRFAAFDFANIEEDIIGTAYEKHLSIENRKKIGQYYTHDFIVDYMIDQVPLDKSLTYFDPACGSGAFLLKICNKLIDKYGAHEAQTIIKSLHGCDINPFAVQLTKMNLMLRSIKEKIFKLRLANIITADSLAKPIKKAKLYSQKKHNIGKNYSKSFVSYNDLHLTNISPTIKANSFDVILANPPYISLGAWRSAKIDEEYSEDLQDFFTEYYPNSAEYKISTYAIFLDRAIELAKHDGIIQFIIPDSFLAGKYFSKLRKLILEKCDIKEITVSFEDFWENAQVGFPVIIRLQKVSYKEANLRKDAFLKQDELHKTIDQMEKIAAQYSNCNEDKKLEKLKKSLDILTLEQQELSSSFDKLLLKCTFNKKFKVKFAKSKLAFIQRTFTESSGDQEQFFRNYNHRFTLFISNIHEAVFKAVSKNTSTVKMLASIECGLCGKDGQENIISDVARGAKWHKGISSAKFLKPYVLNKSSEFLLLDQSKLVRGYNVDYAAPKLIIPKTGDRIKCAIDRTGLLVSDNLQIAIPRPIYSKYLMAICGIFNSDVFNFYYQTITLEAGRVNAQTDIDTLYSIPIKLPNEATETYQKLNDKVESLYLLLKTKSKISSAKINKLNLDINMLVADLLNVKDKKLISRMNQNQDEAA